MHMLYSPISLVMANTQLTSPDSWRTCITFMLTCLYPFSACPTTFCSCKVCPLIINNTTYIMSWHWPVPWRTSVSPTWCTCPSPYSPCPPSPTTIISNKHVLVLFVLIQTNIMCVCVGWVGGLRIPPVHWKGLPSSAVVIEDKNVTIPCQYN